MANGKPRHGDVGTVVLTLIDHSVTQGCAIIYGCMSQRVVPSIVAVLKARRRPQKFCFVRHNFLLGSSNIQHEEQPVHSDLRLVRTIAGSDNKNKSSLYRSP
jgi:hypothetical protein